MLFSPKVVFLLLLGSFISVLSNNMLKEHVASDLRFNIDSSPCLLL